MALNAEAEAAKATITRGAAGSNSGMRRFSSQWGQGKVHSCTAKSVVVRCS